MFDFILKCWILQLPPTLDRRHSQIIFWFNIEDVEADQVPTVMWPTRISRQQALWLTWISQFRLLHR